MDDDREKERYKSTSLSQTAMYIYIFFSNSSVYSLRGPFREKKNETTRREWNAIFGKSRWIRETRTRGRQLFYRAVYRVTRENLRNLTRDREHSGIKG